jgi:fatty-acyl-CoA synthase
MAAPPHPFERDLDPRPANFVPLSPVTFLARAALAYPGKTAVIHGDWRYDYRELDARCRRLASALGARGVGRLDTVAILAANVPAQLEAHFAVPMLGAVLNPLNIRLDPAAIAFSLDHGEAKVLLVDREFAAVAKAALEMLERRPLVIDIADPAVPDGEVVGETEYEGLLGEGDPDFAYPGPDEEWQSIALLYTSGTTGNPKGAVYSHRGAYLAALSNALTLELTVNSVYLWTLPMFHCSGWAFPWAVTALGGTHVCLRRIDPAVIFALIREHRVTHLCGAPIVLNMLAYAPDEQKIRFEHRIKCGTGGAAPPSVVLEAMERLGFEVLHLYGATESYGPALSCFWQDAWAELGEEQRYTRMARQGVGNPGVADFMVADPGTLAPAPKDALTMGEIMLRGNTIMKGYLKNLQATEETLGGGWYHSGDLAVWHPDAYIEIKDRSKDIIISGGENISSLELEEVLFKHPAVMEAAVVARPDEKWGETPCAFVALKPGKEASAEEIIAFCRQHVARFKVPKTVVFGDLPKTSTGKIQKFLLRERAQQL